MKPTYSFIIPNYNFGQYLRTCIESCLAQQVDGEIIVMDGGSTDHSVDVLKSFGEAIQWVSEKDNGQSDAINKGIARANGDFICWINSDDYYAEGRPLAKIAELIQAHPDADVVCGNALYVDKTGEPYREIKGPNPLSWQRLAVNPFVGVLQPGLLFRRQVFLELGGLDESLGFAMDLDLWLRMLSRNPQIVYFPETIACARIHADAKTRSQISTTIREIRSVLRRHQTFQRLPMSMKVRALWSQRVADVYALANKFNLIRAPE